MTQAKGRVLLGTVVIKHLQTLVWWVCDHQKQGFPLVPVVVEEQKAILANTVDKVAVVIKEGADMPTAKVILLTVSMLRTRPAVLQCRNERL
jgi:hypothetical protein